MQAVLQPIFVLLILRLTYSHLLYLITALFGTDGLLSSSQISEQSNNEKYKSL